MYAGYKSLHVTDAIPSTQYFRHRLMQFGIPTYKMLIRGEDYKGAVSEQYVPQVGNYLSYRWGGGGEEAIKRIQLKWSAAAN